MRNKPKKSLGQNFLIDRNIQKKIIGHCALSSDDIVLEIGAGRGELTSQLAKIVKKVYALEIDKYLCAVLHSGLKDAPNAMVLNQDILKFDLNRRFKKHKARIKVVGNIPYYISSPIIERLIRFKDKIDCAYLTVQKEFARRIVSPPGSKQYGSLSCFAQYYTEPRILFNIKKTSFSPAPKVDSSFLRLKIRKACPVKVNDEALFFRVIRTAFNYRRKTLRNSLKGVLPEGKLRDFFSTFNIDANIRPEDLALQDFARLCSR